MLFLLFFIQKRRFEIWYAYLVTVCFTIRLSLTETSSRAPARVFCIFRRESRSSSLSRTKKHPSRASRPAHPQHARVRNAPWRSARRPGRPSPYSMWTARSPFPKVRRERLEVAFSRVHETTPDTTSHICRDRPPPRARVDDPDPPLTLSRPPRCSSRKPMTRCSSS